MINKTLQSGLILVFLIQASLAWTHYEKPYRGSSDAVCEQKEEGAERVCRDLGEHAYKGQLIDGPPMSYEFFMGEAEPYMEESPEDPNWINLP